MSIEEFKHLLKVKGEELYREMPWREDTRPYYVLVSELMLQQTQVARVVPKFQEFIEVFPDENSLANASLADLLKRWQGLGYNRRAKFLYLSAKLITTELEGKFPNTEAAVLKLPGVGKNTAGAILAYAFNQPTLFVETNIRTVYIHHFFANQFDVSDAQIISLLNQTIDRQNPKRFYQNLMDYGSWLKQHGIKNTMSSKHYRKQSVLKGSLREVRGQIIRELSLHEMTEQQLRKELKADHRFAPALEALVRDGLVEATNRKLHLTK